MPEPCHNQLDQTLLSGYLDNELTQADEQRVRIHLEDCTGCRSQYEQLEQLREVSMSTQFAEPTDQQWNERPKGSVSAGARSLGWSMAILWLAITLGFGLWQLWQESSSLLERLLAFGGLTAVALIFISVLIDRLQAARNDPYREVQK